MDIKDYSRMIDEYAWYRQGDIFQIAKVAKELGRDYMEDIVDAKAQLIDSQNKSTVK